MKRENKAAHFLTVLKASERRLHCGLPQKTKTAFPNDTHLLSFTADKDSYYCHYYLVMWMR